MTLPLSEMKRILAAGLTSMPFVSSERAYTQARRALAGFTGSEKDAKRDASAGE
jgi:hypothetical protein